MLQRRVRTRGCEAPFSNLQIMATGGQLAFTAATYALFGVYVSSPAIAIPVVIYSVAVVVLLVSWAYCVSVDPSQPGGWLYPCMRNVKTQDRYCRLCAKVIPGLDHHCEWLNTCIGRRNYAAFFTLATAGVVQHLLEIVFGICTATVWRGDGGSGAIAFSVVICVMGCIGVGSFGSLWVFHIVLIRDGLGTYDWLLLRSMKDYKAAAPTRPETSGSTHTMRQSQPKPSSPTGIQNGIVVSDGMGNGAPHRCEHGGAHETKAEEDASPSATPQPFYSPDDELRLGLEALRDRTLMKVFGNGLEAEDAARLQNTAGLKHYKEDDKAANRDTTAVDNDEDHDVDTKSTEGGVVDTVTTQHDHSVVIEVPAVEVVGGSDAVGGPAQTSTQADTVMFDAAYYESKHADIEEEGAEKTE